MPISRLDPVTPVTNSHTSYRLRHSFNICNIRNIFAYFAS
nr:MAG TPA: hypothetical protein [Caudoviricetes sp.]